MRLRTRSFISPLSSSAAVRAGLLALASRLGCTSLIACALRAALLAALLSAFTGSGLAAVFLVAAGIFSAAVFFAAGVFLALVVFTASAGFSAALAAVLDVEDFFAALSLAAGILSEAVKGLNGGAN